MLSFFKRIFRPKSPSYEAQKQKLQHAKPKERRALAGGEDTHPEILYYLAKDKDPKIRRAVAVNAATPVQASAMLAMDKDEDVRLALASRLVELLPDLSTDEHGQLYAYAVQALGTLAQDEILKIRRALSSALKDSAYAPSKIAGQLARDVEREVSEPILRYCAALSDDDLLDILSGHPAPWVISAIASRSVVNAAVSEAVVSTDDVPANTILINNVGASLVPPSLQMIIDRARDYPEWHAPLAMRQELSTGLAGQLAGFVNESVLTVLEKRSDFDEETRQEIANMVGRRVEYTSEKTAMETPEAKVARYAQAGKLNAEVIQDAMVWQDNVFVVLALAHLSRIHPVIAKKMLSSGTARPIMALCWQAGLSMRLAVALQKDFAKIQPKDMVYAKGGTDYPLTEEDIKWQLEFFGVSFTS